MSETKFTKGEWIVYTADDDYGNLGYDEVVIGMDSYNENCCNYYCSHKVTIDGVESDDVEGMANAYLIAAAPDMYAMLNRIANESYGAEDVSDEVINKLLAKARGEQ